MATDKFQNKYRILSARAKWHDYGGGMYFITICTKHKIHFFGNVCNGEMKFTPIGAYLNEQIKNANQHYPYCEIPLFVVMPNHWHAIVIVDGDKIPYQRRQCGGNGAGAGGADIADCQGWLSVLLGGIKSAVTKFANQNNIDFGWQTRFHDHIIRNEYAMNRIANYIENNPVNWDTDCFNENHLG